MRLQPGSTLGEGQLGLGEGRRRKKEFQTYDKLVSTHEGPLVRISAPGVKMLTRGVTILSHLTLHKRPKGGNHQRLQMAIGVTKSLSLV